MAGQGRRAVHTKGAVPATCGRSRADDAVADPKSKEEKRFARADKDEDGRITLAELVEPRRKAYARLDVNGDGKLSFEEWAIRTIDKFNDADADRNKSLTPGEYATTAPKRRSKPSCSCG